MQARQQAHYFKQGLNFLSSKSLHTRFDVFLSVGTLKNRSFTAFGVSRSEIGIAGRNVTVTPWSGCDEIRFTAFLPFAFVFIETKAVWYYNEVTREVSRRIEGGVIGK